mgnify:CR=1 FL=1
MTCLAVIIALPQFAFAAQPADLVQRGNEALRAGKVEHALADYEQAAHIAPHLPELLYNQAVAQYRSGQYEQARQLFAQTAAKADARLDAKARYNLANCDYAEAVQLADKDKPAAIDRLKSAISHYRNALAGDPTDTDARANAQLAQILIERLQKEEEQQQQQDQQQQDQQQQDQQKQDQPQQDDSSSEQSEQDQRNENDTQDQQQATQPSNQQDNNRNRQSGEQNSVDESEQSSDEQDQQSDNPTEGELDAPNKEDDSTRQQDQSERPQRTPSDDAHSRDGKPSGEAGGKPQFSDEEAHGKAEAQPMTPEEAQKMLQAVRDRELLRRLKQQKQSHSRRVPVDRDW